MFFFTVRFSGYSPLSCIIESPAFYENLSALDHMDFISNLHKTSKEQEESIIEEIGLKDRIKEKVKAYSLGMKQRLGIGLCLAAQPKLLILDEPTNALDPTGIFEFREMIAKISKEKNVAVVISSHNLAEIQKICDNLVFIKKGVIVSEKENLQRNDIKTYRIHIKNPASLNTEEFESLEFCEEIKLLNSILEVTLKTTNLQNLFKYLTKNSTDYDSFEESSYDIESDYSKIYEGAK